jgi:hypothetical protein
MKRIEFRGPLGSVRFNGLQGHALAVYSLLAGATQALSVKQIKDALISRGLMFPAANGQGLGYILNSLMRIGLIAHPQGASRLYWVVATPTIAT